MADNLASEFFTTSGGGFPKLPPGYKVDNELTERHRSFPAPVGSGSSTMADDGTYILTPTNISVTSGGGDFQRLNTGRNIVWTVDGSTDLGVENSGDDIGWQAFCLDDVGKINVFYNAAVGGDKRATIETAAGTVVATAVTSGDFQSTELDNHDAKADVSVQQLASGDFLVIKNTLFASGTGQSPAWQVVDDTNTLVTSQTLFPKPGVGFAGLPAAGSRLYGAQVYYVSEAEDVYVGEIRAVSSGASNASSAYFRYIIPIITANGQRNAVVSPLDGTMTGFDVVDLSVTNTWGADQRIGIIQWGPLVAFRAIGVDTSSDLLDNIFSTGPAIWDRSIFDKWLRDAAKYLGI